MDTHVIELFIRGIFISFDYTFKMIRILENVKQRKKYMTNYVDESSNLSMRYTLVTNNDNTIKFTNGFRWDLGYSLNRYYVRRRYVMVWINLFMYP